MNLDNDTLLEELYPLDQCINEPLMLWVRNVELRDRPYDMIIANPRNKLNKKTVAVNWFKKK